MTRPPSGGRRVPLLWLAAIVLVAANLRPVISSVPPLVDQLAATFGLSAVAVGALTTLPVVCMGLFAPVAAFVSGRALPVAVGLIAVGAAVRGVGGVVGLYASTAVAGIGIAIAGTLLPALVRTQAPARVGPVTGLYTAALISGAFVAAGTSEPIRSALDLSAVVALALWSLPALAALVVALVVLSRDHDPEVMVDGVLVPSRHDRRDLGLHRRDLGLPWRSRAAWLATLFMGTQSLLFYATLAWFAALYTSTGYPADRAGLLLALFSATQIPTALVMPVLALRRGDPRAWTAVSVGLTTVGLVLVAAVPEAVPWLWAAVLGVGMGGNLALALTALTQAAPDPGHARSYAAMAFSGGYLLAAVGPVAAGALLDATGSYRAVFAVLAGLGVVTLGLGVAAGRPRSRQAH